MIVLWILLNLRVKHYFIALVVNGMVSHVTIAWQGVIYLGLRVI